MHDSDDGRQGVTRLFATVGFLTGLKDATRDHVVRMLHLAARNTVQEELSLTFYVVSSYPTVTPAVRFYGLNTEAQMDAAVGRPGVWSVIRPHQSTTGAFPAGGAPACQTVHTVGPGPHDGARRQTTEGRPVV